MTDEMLKSIQEDFRAVAASVHDLSGKISGMESTIGGVEKTLDRHETAIKETRDAQLCGGIKGGAVKALFKTYGHWALIALFALGFYLGSGGDEERTFEAIEALIAKVEQIEEIKTEPIHVPVPVTASDMYSEEITPR